jgi:hypothetical protein
MDISALMEKGRFLGLREVERENTLIQRSQTVSYMSYLASRITLVFVINGKRKYSLKFVLQAFWSFDLTWKIIYGTRHHRFC